MSFVDRAISEYERGNPPRAALMLANGLRREPDNERALNYLLKLYVEDIDRVGMEKDVLRILELQPDGLELYELVETRLAELGASTRLTALQRTRARAQMLPEPNVERIPIGDATTSSKMPAVKEAPRRVGRSNSSSSMHEDRADSGLSRSQHAGGESDSIVRQAPLHSETRDEAISHGLGSHGKRHDEQVGVEVGRDENRRDELGRDELGRDELPTSDWDRVELPTAKQPEQSDDFVRTPATTGVFSTLDAVVREDSERELHDWYRRRNTRRILTGLAILLALFFGLFVVWPMLSGSSESEVDDERTIEGSNAAQLVEDNPGTDESFDDFGAPAEDSQQNLDDQHRD